jgi:hypothetical protein
MLLNVAKPHSENRYPAYPAPKLRRSDSQGIIIRNQAKLMFVPESVPENPARWSSKNLRTEQLTVVVIRYHATLDSLMEL